MQVPATDRRTVRFGAFSVDLVTRELQDYGHEIPLQEKPFQVLAILLEQPGQLITREEIQHRLWPADTFVDFEHGINTAVKKLREALNDHAEQPRFIETVPRRGYRFIAAITETTGVAATPSLRTLEEPPVDREPPTRWRYGRNILLAAVALVLGGALLIAWNPAGIRDRLSKTRVAAGAAPIRIESIAVLPFENLSGDSSKDYFADGFTDELITDLAEQTRARVVSRSSVMRYKGSRKPLPEIARDLNVDAIVEGSVSLSEQKVRITTQLIQGSSDRHLWAHSYERDRKDLFSVQSEVAATIAALIRTRADGLPSTTVRPVSFPPRFNAETYELSLECRNLRMTSTDDGVTQAIRCYQHILALDPNSAAAYAELAYCYLALGLDSALKARAAASRAIDLDPSLPDAHLALANFKAVYEKDLMGAKTEFQQALALNPSFAQAHLDYSLLLVAIQQATDAMAEAKTARELDPFSAAIATSSGRTLFMVGQYDRAIEEEKAALQLDSHRGRAHYWLGYAYEQKGMYREAIAEYEQGLPDDDHSVFLAALGRSFVLEGDSGKAAEVKRKMERLSGKSLPWPYDAALFYAALGDKDQAFKWLEKDHAMRDGWLLLLNVDPRLSTLRSDARFLELARRVGLPPPG